MSDLDLSRLTPELSSTHGVQACEVRCDGGGARKAQINVTPLIDVLLVLIIIFMVVLPERSTGLPTPAAPPTERPRSSHDSG